MASDDVCPCCGKKLVSLVPVSAEARAVIDSLVPDKDGFVCVPAGLVKFVERKVKRVRKNGKL